MSDLMTIEQPDKEPNFEGDLYEILGISKTASNMEIRAAYRSLAKKYHPDRPSGNNDKFVLIQKAYEILYDPVTRGRYDETGETQTDNSVVSSAMQHLSMQFRSVLKQNIQNVDTVDMVATVRHAINNQIASNKNGLRQLKTVVKNLKKAQSRLRGKNHLLHDVMADEILQINKAITDGEKTTRMQNMMLDMLLDYDYEVESAPQTMSYSTICGNFGTGTATFSSF